MGEALQSLQTDADVTTPGKPQVVANDTFARTRASVRAKRLARTRKLPVVHVRRPLGEIKKMWITEEDRSSQDIASTAHRQAAGDGMNFAERAREDVDRNEGRQMEPVRPMSLQGSEL